VIFTLVTADHALGARNGSSTGVLVALGRCRGRGAIAALTMAVIAIERRLEARKT